MSWSRGSCRRYFVAPGLLRDMELPGATTFTRIEPHRLRALILEDLGRHPDSGFGEIHDRIGKEIPVSHVRRAIKALVDDGKVLLEGQRHWRRYGVSEDSGGP